MTIGAFLFMALSWGFVLTLTAWCYHRVLRSPTPTARKDSTARDARP